MSNIENVDNPVVMALNARLNNYSKIKSPSISNDDLNSLLDELILQLQQQKRSQEENALNQVIYFSVISVHVLKMNFDG